MPLPHRPAFAAHSTAGSARLAPDRLHALARNAFRRFGKDLRKARPQAVACREGCNHCCRSIPVSLSLPEIFLLKAHLESLPDARFAAVKSRFAGRPPERPIDAASRAPCPLLDGDRCGVYAVRPLSCRAAVSLDADKCRRASEGEPVRIDMPAAYMRALETTSLKLKALMAAAGLDCRAYELKAALRIALEAPDVERRWLDGEDVFAPAEMLGPGP